MGRASEDVHATDRAYLSKSGAARLIGVSERTLDRLRREEGLPFIRVGRLIKFRRSDVEEWLNRRAETMEMERD